MVTTSFFLRYTIEEYGSRLDSTCNTQHSAYSLQGLFVQEEYLPAS
jgi:hypothetical protein